MRLIVLYSAQVIFIALGLATIGSVFVSITTKAMDDTVKQLVDEAAAFAVSAVLAPLDKFAVQLVALSDTVYLEPGLMSNRPGTPQWAETAIVAQAASYVPALTPVNTSLLLGKFAVLFNNPLASYVYESFQMPDNASQWMDNGVGRMKPGAPNPMLTFQPSLHRGGETASPDYVDCYMNLTLDDGRLTAAQWELSSCEVLTDTTPEPLSYQLAARAMKKSDKAAGKWLSIYVDPFDKTGKPSILMSFGVPLSFSAVDTTTGAYHCIAAMLMDLNGAYLADALALSVADGVTLALFNDDDGSLLSWTLNQPQYDTATRTLLVAGATNSFFDDALNLMRSAGWCTPNASSSASTSGFAPCGVRDDGALVRSASKIFTLRRVEHINVKLSLVIAGDREKFFGPGDQARAVCIGVAVALSLVVLASSVAMWAATSRPLKRLIDNMQLAATLDPNVSVETESWITELSEANVAFVEMHDQLQTARPYMPQGLLLQLDERRLMRATNGAAAPLPEIDEDLASTGQQSSSKYTARKKDGTRANRERDNESQRSHRSQLTHPTNTSGSDATSMALPLEPRSVAVLVCNTTGFDALLPKVNAEYPRFTAHYAKIVTAITQSVAAHNGVIDSIRGDHVVVTFNATKRCAAPASKAVQAAFSVRRMLLDDAELDAKWKSMTFGVSCGRAICGTLGNDSVKAHMTIGPVVRQAIVFQRLARVFDQHHQQGDTVGDQTQQGWCVGSAAVAAECATFAHYKHEALARLPPNERLVLVSRLYPPTLPFDVASFPSGAPGAVPAATANHQQAAAPKDNEWLYAVSATNGSNVHDQHNIRAEDFLKKTLGGGANVADWTPHRSALNDTFQQCSIGTLFEVQ